MTNPSALAVKDATGATQNIPFPNGNGQAPMAASAPVVIASDQIVPVSAAALPLPAGAAADGSDGSGIPPPTGGAGIRGWLSGIYSKLSSPLSVTGTFWQATQPVSLSALPTLPAGANLIGAVNLDLGGSAVSATNPLPMIDAYTAPSASAWTSATTLNSASTVTTGGYDTVIVTLVGNGSLAGGTVAFEVYDGAAWIAVKAASVTDYTTAASASLTANMNRGYQVPVAGFPQFRVRLAGVISGGSVTITTITSSAPDTSIVTVGLDPAQPLPAGTNAIGTVLGPLPTSPITGQQTLATTAAALPANALQNGLIVTALVANTGTVYVGASGVTTTTGYPLSAGQSISFAVASASGISIIGSVAGDKIAFAGN
jgi:hypothetical protein